MRRAGFTLIEMMIVVAIIAVIAAIAIPNLLASRRQANEANAIAACKEIGFAQSVYHRTDWDGDAIHEYVTPYTLLYSQVAPDGNMLKLISEALMLASTPANPLQGYFFTDIISDSVTGPYVLGGNQEAEYGISANPTRYAKSGVNTYIMSAEGIVYAQDQGATAPVLVYPANARAAGWVVAQ